MKKKILDLMKAEFVKNISSAELELIGGDLQENRKRDAEGKETGDVERFVRIEVEVRKGNGSLSRLQISVKIPNGELKFKEEDLEKTEYLVFFDELEISFIDAKGNAYFRAKDYYVEEVINDGI